VNFAAPNCDRQLVKLMFFSGYSSRNCHSKCEEGELKVNSHSSLEGCKSAKST
jgi:hypothetical protein